MRLVAVDAIASHPDGAAAFRVVIPASAKHGPRLDWVTVTTYGRTRGTAGTYRAYLAAAHLLDYTAHKGRPVTPTVPARLLDHRGRAVRQPGGKGKVVRDRRTGTEPHPSLHRVPILSVDDLAHAAGFRAGDRKARSRGMAAWEQLVKDGHIVMLDAGRDRFRIVSPD